MTQFQRKGKWLEVQISKHEAGSKPIEILESCFHLSKSMIEKLRQRDGIQINGQSFDEIPLVKSGDRVRVLLFESEDYGVVPEAIDLEVLYEDDHLLVVNKAAGIAVHPTEPDQTGTLAHAVAYHYQLQGEQIKVRHIHRLDKDTSGVLLIAKHAVAHALLDEALRKRLIKRTYLAVATGKISPKQGTIEAAIGRDRHHPTRRRVSPTGDPAITHYQVITQLPEATIVQLELETGRTHQIRVHLSHIGHPLYGDTMYGGPRYPIRRQALHGERLQFVHPITGEALAIVAPLPDDIKKLIDYLKAEA